MLVPRRVLIYHRFLWVVTASIVLLSCLQFGGDQNLSGYPPNRSTIYSEVSGRNFIKPPRPHKRTTMKQKIVSKKALAPIEIKASKRRLFQTGNPSLVLLHFQSIFFQGAVSLEKPVKNGCFPFLHASRFVEKNLQPKQVPGFQVMCFFQCIFTPPENSPLVACRWL